MKNKIEKLEILRVKRATLQSLLQRLPKHNILYDDYSETTYQRKYGENEMIDQIRRLILDVIVEYTPSHVDQIKKDKRS